MVVSLARGDSCLHSDHNIDTAPCHIPGVICIVSSDIMSDGDLDLSLSPVKKNVAKQVNTSLNIKGAMEVVTR